MDIWAACRDAAKPIPLEGELIRFVESQEQIATNALVDSLEEQSLLEALLEQSKPPPLPQTAHLHYLLATPFRYPPLKHGSRFGTRQEPSLFYGSRDQSAALAENAYYRFVFWSGMLTPPPSGRLTTEHTAFGARYSTQQGLCLYEEPFLGYADRLTNPQDYTDTQQLGQNLRDAGVEAFAYRSARDPAQGINVALFYPRAFSHPTPVWQESWICETSDDKVSFYSKGYGTRFYQRTTFLVAGKLPAPAV
jgi:hypothetical protein